jgi:NAD(P)H-dependent FMN reductase
VVSEVPRVSLKPIHLTLPGTYTIIKRKQHVSIAMNKIINILAISGSLRADSSATAVMKEVTSMMPEGVHVTVYEGLGNLPHFNDSLTVPAEVDQFRKMVAEADGVLICTPEYAFGIPGSLKNALDWTVGTGEFVEKPVALITAASVGKNAHAALLLTLTALSARVAEGAEMVIPFIRARLDENKKIKDASLRQEVNLLVQRFLSGIQAADPVDK